MSNNDEFKGTLPYASELFGVYQPLLGWKSNLIMQRVNKALTQASKALIVAMLHDPHELYEKIPELHHPHDPRGDLQELTGPGYVDPMPEAWRNTHVGRYVQNEVDKVLSKQGGSLDDKAWASILSRPALKRAIGPIDAVIPRRGVTGTHTLAPPANLARLDTTALKSAVTRIDALGIELCSRVAIPEAQSRAMGFLAIDGTDLMVREIRASQQQELVVAEALRWLSSHAPTVLTALFTRRRPPWEAASHFIDPLATFDPDVQLAVLSPIGIVHLYREYFFELDTFLGPPVGHVWISPGGTVELYEVNTRRSLMERTTEAFTETISKSELTTTEHDEISDAIKEENQRNVKFGSSVSAGSNIFGIVQARASADYSFETTNKQAAETTHKHMREQSERVSSEIRRNFKTTFRTEQETSDTSSRRYVVQNTTNKLVNYELRRKMRKVMVQVQHIGTQMCWQTYVDEPGSELGLGMLVHVASPQDLQASLTPPEAPSDLKPKTTQITQDFLYEPDGTHMDKTDNFYKGASDDAKIIWHREYSATPPTGYELAEVTGIAVNHPQDGVSARLVCKAPHTFEIWLDFVNFHDKDFITFQVNLTWVPSNALLQAADTAFKTKLAEYKEAESRKAREEYVKSVRDRIKAAGNVRPRPAEELREEERTVIYRSLIRQLMQVASGQESHVVAELVRSLFDVDKMLYFVAPEWWMPRARGAQQVMYAGRSSSGDALVVTDQDLVGWGGIGAQGRANYLITEESEPAPLGSSIGWLLQLDGDSHRNAFLNSPWVKAVIPVQPGREMAALKWLHNVPEGEENLDAQYAGPVNPAYLEANWDAQHLTLEQALEALAKEIATQNTDISNTLKTETVFEKGFDPLQGGLRATGTPYEVFDQWIEVLPTDQLAAVEVEYDPKTLQVKSPA